MRVNEKIVDLDIQKFEQLPLYVDTYHYAIAKLHESAEEYTGHKMDELLIKSIFGQAPLEEDNEE